MTARQAIAFVKRHGVVLEAARGPVPSLAEAIAGEALRGSWWGHPKAHQIHRLLGAVRDSEDVLVCRLVDGKITFVHRRLWPALVRVAKSLPAERIAAISEIHTPSGKHKVVVKPFSRWVPAAVREQGRARDERAAATALGEWFTRRR